MRPIVRKGLALVFAAFIGYAGYAAMSQDDNEGFASVATFNMEWLGDGVQDIKPRTDQQYLMIADIVAKTGADVVGVQEIENQAALRKVLRYLQGYDGFVAEGDGDQHVGVIYKKGVSITRLGTYSPLVVLEGRNRPGLLVRAKKGSLEWLMMVVHLKSTSRYDSTTELRAASRQQRQQQVHILKQWSDSVVAAGSEPNVMILGDFNDYTQRKSSPTLTELSSSSAMHFLTATLKSCRSSQEYGIDHIVVSSAMKARYITESAHYENFNTYLQTDEAKHVSDHCPLVVRFSTSR